MNENHNIKERLISLLKNNEIDIALNEMDDLISPDSNQYDSIINLQRRFKEYQKDKKLNLVSIEDSQLRINRIQEGALYVINNLGLFDIKKDIVVKTKSKQKIIRLLAFFIALLILGLSFYTFKYAKLQQQIKKGILLKPLQDKIIEGKESIIGISHSKEDSLGNTLEELRVSSGNLENQVYSFQDSIYELQTAIIDHINEIESIKAKLESKHAEIRSLKDEINNKLESFQNNYDSLSMLKIETDSLNQELSEELIIFRIKLKRIEIEKEMLILELEEMTKRNDKIFKLLKKTIEDYNKLYDEYQKNVPKNQKIFFPKKSLEDVEKIK